MEADISCRLGAGRYTQGENAVRVTGKEAARLGKKALIISGQKEWSMIGEDILASLLSEKVEAVVNIYDGQSSYTAVDSFKKKALSSHADLIIGIGGGRNMDVSKGAAHVSGLPLLLIPTSSATCAAFTPLSVMYTDEGKGMGPWHHEREVDAVIVDETILSKQPPRLFAAGVLDAMAKYVEIPNGREFLSLEEDGIEKYSAFCSARYLYELLFTYGLRAYKDVADSRMTKLLHDIIYANIALTGIVSNMMRGVGQTALAHNFGKAVHTIYPVEAEDFLHGELVAIGMLMQLRYNNDKKEIPRLRAFMISMGMPVSIRDLDLPDVYAAEKIEQFISESIFVPHTDEGREKLHDAIKEIR